MSVGMPSTGMQPMANPSARVSARRWGEMPWCSQMGAVRLIEFKDVPAIALTLSMVPQPYR
jgi:hypothetical protein